MRISRLHVNGGHASEREKHHDYIELVEGIGVASDRHADPLSPMQVQVTSVESLSPKFLVSGGNNIVIEGVEMGALRSGDAICVGKSMLRVTYGYEDCSVRCTQKGMGVYAVVVVGGTVRIGAPAFIRQAIFAEMPATRYERLLWFMQQVPVGKVVTYSHAVRAIGGSKVHFRSLPQYIKRAASEGALTNLHRLVDSQGKVIRHLPKHAERLILEGIDLDEGGRVHSNNFWVPTSLYGVRNGMVQE